MSFSLSPSTRARIRVAAVKSDPMFGLSRSLLPFGIPAQSLAQGGRGAWPPGWTSAREPWSPKPWRCLRGRNHNVLRVETGVLEADTVGFPLPQPYFPICGVQGLLKDQRDLSRSDHISHRPLVSFLGGGFFIRLRIIEPIVSWSSVSEALAKASSSSGARVSFFFFKSF